MTDQAILSEVIRRVERMELIFDTLLDAFKTDPASIFNDPSLYASLQELTRYYDGGQWLHDYEIDELWKLPADLKRGVLAQDAVFDFLADLKIFTENTPCT